MPFCSQVANAQITIVTVFDIKRNSAYIYIYIFVSSAPFSY